MADRPGSEAYVRAAFRALAVALFVSGGAFAADAPPRDNMFAQWSPNGEQIVFTSERDDDKEIYVMNADGAGQNRLTQSPGLDAFPTFSPDGRRIAFTSEREGDSEIYVMNADGSSPRRLTNSPGRDAHPAFSRDGRRIVFQSPRNGGDVNVFAMNSEGGDPIQLTWLLGFAGVPVYSPDDTHIAFQWRPGGKPGDASRKWVICVMASDGSRMRVITDGRFNDQVPNWSSDGKKLVFFSDRTGTNQIYKMDPDGGAVSPVSVATSNSNDVAPFWSPDDGSVVFASDRDGTMQIYVMRRDGSNAIRLTGAATPPRAP
jgi:TolB protein